MLGFLFGFNARLGRLAFFGASIGLGIIITLLAVALVFAMKPLDLRLLESPFRSWPIMIFVIFVLWANAMLQSMRIRDIGWDPVCILPLWLASMAIDYVVATKHPEWAISQTHAGTAVGALINLGLSLALMFWPSSADNDGPRDRDVFSSRSARTQAQASFAETRLARITGGKP